ncbi:MAG: DMT family transporter [Proteobacteria bacterium]|nr:DMT family transporter [Pseudomonadota bacterium]
MSAATLELTLLGMIWGGSFLFMRIAAGPFGPLPLVETRLALGALILLPFLWSGRTRMNARLWLRFAGIAAVNSVIPFSLFAWAAERAPAGIGAITNAMAVMFTALWALVLFRERISRPRLIGLIAGFAGVAVLALGRSGGTHVWPAALAGMTAALCYGLGLILARHYLAGLPSGLVAAANLTTGAIMLAPFALATWPAQPIPVNAWVSAVLLGVLCTGIAFVLYFRLLARIGPHRTSTVTYLVPLFAVLWAYLALGEPLTPTMAIAGVLILVGVALSQQEARR